MISQDIVRWSAQSVDRCPADAHDVRAGIARLPVDASRIEKIGRASESKIISNDQELIQSDPTPRPQNQKGNN